MKTLTEEKGAKVSKHPDADMTPAQIARRKFKSMLPRKIKDRTGSPMQALGETFTLLDQFRSMVRYENRRTDTDGTIYAALAYSIPGAAQPAFTLTVPEPGNMDTFCDFVLGLSQADFLGLIFVQVDPDAKKEAYKAVSFVVPFRVGPDATARLLYAQKAAELAKIQKVLEGLGN